MKKVLINISGGAIKFIALISCLRELTKKGVQPLYVSGVSAGAMIVLFYVCGKIEEAHEMAMRSDDIRLIFSKKNDPTRRFVQIRNLLLGRNYMGVMDNLEKHIRSIVSKEDFFTYQRESPVKCFILSVDERTQKQVVVNLKDLTYEQAIDHVIGSSSIAPTVKTRKSMYDGIKYHLNDGGHRDHSAGGFILKNRYVRDIDECITIWSRPEPKVYNGVSEKDTSNFIKRLDAFTISTFIRELSINDEELEIQECEDRKARYSPIYIPYFTSSTYGISKQEVKEGDRLGRESAQKYLRSSEK